MTRPLIVGTNFKLNQTPAESAEFITELARSEPARPGVRLYLIPPFTSLPAVVDDAAQAEPSSAPIWIGAQNMHWAPDGAYTGEISARMLTALGVDLVLIGHAERRRLFHETDPDLNKKVLAAVAAGLRVLLCVGESAEEKGFGVGRETVGRQLKIALAGVEEAAAGLLQVAYEPVWSIGAGGTPAQAEDVIPIAAHLRATLVARFPRSGAEVPILYGGSVNPTNAGTFVALPEIDGLLVGRAAWTVDGFRRVLAAAVEVRG